MATVMFSTTCDIRPQGQKDPCGVRAVEYSRHPVCRYCGDDVCSAHARPNSLEEDRQYDGSRQVVCCECHPETEDQLMDGETWEQFNAPEPEPDYDYRSADDFDGWEDEDRAGTRR
jgi:hypothetical protein